ncbi:helix-turn-helix transcriptional regulator [Halothiobacillus diazotrophicus]|uniref:helix-turn-helix transcriptional regulator n=1 Tax=Halothiobacillus diazotrophicus TaxID=1860122 RepID=UPI0012E8D6EF|nr:hypothetical protein [Halothiobacillus diazotrophicus]
MTDVGKDTVDLDTYDTLVCAIYDAANDPALWRAFLERLTEAFRGHGASLRLLDAHSHYPSFSASHGYDDTFTQQYLDYYYQTDISIPILEDADQGTVIARSEFIQDRDYQNSEYFQDFGRRWGINDLLGGYFMKTPSCNARIGVHRPLGEPTFGPEDKQLMSRLMPHLHRAFQISRHIQQIKAQQMASQHAFDHIPFGVVLVDSDGKPVVVNRQAEDMSRKDGGILIRAEGISTGAPQTTQVLRHLIQQATGHENGKSYSGGALSVERARSTLPLSIMVAPLNAGQSVFGRDNEQATAVVFISDPLQEQHVSPEILSILYGLTKAEARLARELALGRTLDEISDRYQLSKHTLRAQLKATFGKTGISRQSELVRLVLGGPATLSLNR